MESFGILTPGDLNFDLSQKMTEMISKWFFASFRTLPFVFLYGDQEPRSWGGGGVQTPPPPSRRWKIQRPSRARVNPPPRAWAVSVPTTAWGGGGSDPIPVLSRKRIDVERRTRRHSKDLDETLPNHFRKFKIEVTCQVKVRSKVKIGCFQVADRSDLKCSIFLPKLSICTPRDQTKVLTSEIFSYENFFVYLAHVNHVYLAQVKVRSEKVTKPKIFKWVVWHMFCGPFLARNSIVTNILQFDLIWTNKMRKSIQGYVKKVKKRSNFIFWKQRHVSEA